MASPSSPNLPEDRHCAFCLKSISGEEVKICGKCHRRAYCSKECQSKDWKNPSTTGNEGQRGQGHKNWCGVLCGEEDIDWKIAPVEGKGLGLIALKPLPARTRIIVDACQISPHAHPAIKDLLPRGKHNLQEKWDLNVLGSFDGSFLCLRISRANHECNPNAGHIYCPTFKVKTLFAEWDIGVGEEICIDYQPWSTCPTPEEFPLVLLRRRYTLQYKWGITCPPDCFCTDSNVIKDAWRALELEAILARVTPMTHAVRMRDAAQLLTLHHGRLSSSYLVKGRGTLWDAFQLGIMTKATLPKGMEYIKKMVEVMGDILHPKSKAFQDYVGFLKNPASNEHYLRYDK